jgi:hypothetical protein
VLLCVPLALSSCNPHVFQSHHFSTGLDVESWIEQVCFNSSLLQSAFLLLCLIHISVDEDYELRKGCLWVCFPSGSNLIESVPSRALHHLLENPSVKVMVMKKWESYSPHPPKKNWAGKLTILVSAVVTNWIWEALFWEHFHQKGKIYYPQCFSYLYFLG